jgi:hypothetical protein
VQSSTPLGGPRAVVPLCAVACLRAPCGAPGRAVSAHGIQMLLR